MQLVQFYLSLFLVFILPGYFLLRVLFAKKYFNLLSLEKLLLTFVLSLASTDFIMLLMNYLHISITRQNLFLSLIFWSLAWWLIMKFKTSRLKASPETKIFKQKFTYRQSIYFIILLAITIFLRAIYVGEGIIPKSTDLGHHSYWINYITLNGNLPHYSEKFIIGEHLPFAALNILGHLPIISPTSTIVLLIFNIFTLLAVFLLIYSLAKNILPSFKNSLGKEKLSPYNIALWGLFTVGILYPITAPQAKFVSGGVVGNIIGNLLLIIVIYSFSRAILNKSVAFANIFFISLFTIIYTHHLSTLVLGYSLIGIVLAFAFLVLLFSKFNIILFSKTVLKYLKIFFNWRVWLVILLGIFFLWQVRLPSYLNKSAIDTAVGTPTKITRVGISLSGIINRVGPWRVMFASVLAIILIGLLLSLLKNIYQRKNIKNSIAFSKLVKIALVIAVLVAWAKIIFFMSWKPAWLKIDIPSSRIITYLTYPLAIMSAFGISVFLASLKNKLDKNLFTFLFVFFLGIAFISGFSQDIAENLRSAKNNDSAVIQTYLATKYLAKNSQANEQVLKDHIHLSGDTWMKIFFMRGYKYPLSRTYSRRYEDKYNKHETCTRDMIAKPNSEIGKECFTKTKVKYIFLRKGYDDALFLKSDNFQEIYSSGTIRIFERK